MAWFFCFLLGFHGDAKLDFAFPSTLSHPVSETSSVLVYLYLLRTLFYLLDSSYSAISVRLVGDNQLIHVLSILTSLELFLNHEFYSRYPDLTGEKLFTFYESVFDLARGLRDCKTNINNKNLLLTMFIIFSDFLMVQRSFISPLVKRRVIISNKLDWYVQFASLVAKQLKI